MNYFQQFLSKRGYTKETLQKLMEYQIRYIKGTEEVCKYLHDLPRNTKIGLISDFDCDGYMAGIINYLSLHMLGFNNVVIAKRDMKKGYEFKAEDVDALDGIKVMLTSDVGITCHSAINYAVNKGITVILTDHHIPSKDMSGCKAHFVIDHMMDDEFNSIMRYPVCGAYTSYQIYECYTSMYRDEFENYSNLIYNLKHISYFAAIATVADAMPLLGVNRALVKDMLSAFDRICPANGSSVPVTSMNLNSPVQQAYENMHRFVNKLIDNYYKGFDISFLIYRIIPIINSTKRMDGDGNLVYNMILGDVTDSFRAIDALIILNDTRKTTIEQKYQDIYIRGKNQLSMDLIYKTDINQGLAGLLAAQILSVCKLPTVVLCSKLYYGEETGEYYYKGSTRSPGWFRMLDTVNASGLAKCSGHNHACGISVPVKNVQALHDLIQSAIVKYEDSGVNNNVSIEDDFDIVVTALTTRQDILDIDNFMMDVKSLEPYGMCFEAPKILVKFPKTLGAFSSLKGGRHTKIQFGNNFSILLWDTTEEEVGYSEINGKIYLTGYFSDSVFKGVRSINFIATPVFNKDKSHVNKVTTAE